MTNDSQNLHGCAVFTQQSGDLRNIQCDCGAWFGAMSEFAAHLSEARWGSAYPSRRTKRRYPDLGQTL